MDKSACCACIARPWPAILLVLAAGPALSQQTSNIAPRMTLAGASESVRSDTLCVALEADSVLTFPGLSVADLDIGDGLVHARVELEPVGTGTPAVSIPGLADLPGVVIIREETDRIRFNAPLASVNAAFAALEYAGVQPGDMLDLIADDLQVPPLSAEIRLRIEAGPSGEPPSIARCRPPPDLRPESDSGASSEDDITAAGVLLFDVAGVVAGDVVQLMNDDLLVTEAIATAETFVIADLAPPVGETALYSLSVNGDLGTAAWSVAIESAALFGSGFEELPQPAMGRDGG